MLSNCMLLQIDAIFLGGMGTQSPAIADVCHFCGHQLAPCQWVCSLKLPPFNP